MKVKLLVSISGTRDGVPWPEHGAVVDLPEDEATHYVNAGIAKASDEDVTYEFTPLGTVTKPKAAKAADTQA